MDSTHPPLATSEGAWWLFEMEKSLTILFGKYKPPTNDYDGNKKGKTKARDFKQRPSTTPKPKPVG